MLLKSLHLVALRETNNIVLRTTRRILLFKKKSVKIFESTNKSTDFNNPSYNPFFVRFLFDQLFKILLVKKRLVRDTKKAQF